uniref:GGDEF domain-containing protein n=1 Tax=Marinobacterium jannaschii TaxID=64970 RepID=UPI000B0A0044|nr:GGDEF domain-containing protein [Marinobacterium jannaschii]
MAGTTELPGWLLVSGLTINVLIVIYLIVLLRHNRVISALIKQRESEIADARAMLEKVSSEDKLTGLANRTTLEQRLQVECRRAQREFSPLTLAVIDLDNLKGYNDRFGYEAGDECLQQVAALLKQKVSRPGDLVARLASDQFALLLPSTNEHSRHFADGLRQAIEALAITHADAPSGVMTSSLGIVTLQPSADLLPERALDMALQQLQRAKSLGGNRAEYFAERSDEPPVTLSY